jgi:hypothetical protein
VPLYRLEEDVDKPNMTATLKPVVFLVGTLCCFFCESAAAYRPFISTDPAVADTGESEVELGADYINDHGQNTVNFPSLRYNYGFATNWEATLEGSLPVFVTPSLLEIEFFPSIPFKNNVQDAPSIMSYSQPQLTNRILPPRIRAWVCTKVTRP